MWSAVNSSNEKSQWEAKNNSRAIKAYKGKIKESSTDAPSAKDKAILAAAEKIKQKESVYAEMAKRLDDTEALPTQAANELSEKEKIIR